MSGKTKSIVDMILFGALTGTVLSGILLHFVPSWEGVLRASAPRIGFNLGVIELWLNFNLANVLGIIIALLVGKKL